MKNTCKNHWAESKEFQCQAQSGGSGGGGDVAEGAVEVVAVVLTDVMPVLTAATA